METKTKQNEECIETCNSLLRGELSAIETYTKAIEKFEGVHDIVVLSGIRDDHETTAGELRQNIVVMGGQPSSESGMWGDFATGVQAAANLFGEDSAITCLIQGEKHGIREYEEAIAKDSTMATCREKMRNFWLPRLHAHIEKLERFD